MKRKFLSYMVAFGLTVSVATFGIPGSKAYGDIITGDFDVTLASLLAGNDTLQVADKLFFGFEAVNAGFNLESIHVKPRIIEYNGEMEYGLLFQLTSGSTVFNGQSIDLLLDFGITTTYGDNRIHDAYMDVVGGAEGDAGYNISEDIYSNEDLQNGLADLFVYKNAEIFKSIDIAFFDPQDILFVHKDIQIYSEGCETSAPCENIAFLSHFSQLFSQVPTTGDSSGNSTGTTSDVPEPTSMMLLGFGAAGLAAWRRRRAR